MIISELYWKRAMGSQGDMLTGLATWYNWDNNTDLTQEYDEHVRWRAMVANTSPWNMILFYIKLFLYSFPKWVGVSFSIIIACGLIFSMGHIFFLILARRLNKMRLIRQAAYISQSGKKNLGHTPEIVQMLQWKQTTILSKLCGKMTFTDCMLC